MNPKARSLVYVAVSESPLLGTTGSGKTTLARQVAQYLQIPYIELDALYWEPNWTAASEEVFRERVTEAVSSDRWIIDGNYSQSHQD